VLTLILIGIIIIAVAVFSAQNAAPVAVTFIVWRYEASLAVVVVLALLTGVVVGMILLSLIRLRRSLLRSRKKDGTADKTIAQDSSVSDAL
jgi:lipopolysaccharide assembly protein A